MRGDGQYVKIATAIRNCVSQRHGNYMIFFPSYAFLEQVLTQYLRQGLVLVEDQLACHTVDHKCFTNHT